MIDAAADCGCDCVKFQSWSAESLYSQTYYKQNPIAKRFVNKFSMSAEQLFELSEYCRNAGVDFASTPYSCEEVDFLAEKAKAPFIKIASMELNNYPFLDYIARKGVPIVLSTGMGTIDEICRAVETIENAGNHSICLLHCISIYPPEISTINLLNIVGLQEKFPEYPIGFSDHSSGTEMAAAAVALGACLIEKHITLDNSKIGMDNQMATEPDKMKLLVNQCHNVWTALGSKNRTVLEAELEQRKNMRRSLIFTRDISAGETLSETDIDSKRPGTGFPPEDKVKFVGKTVTRNVEKDTLITQEDFE
jgi:N-acetylneuraminate synthase